MVRKKWFDRKFEFDPVNGTIDSILEQLRYTPLRLIEKISGIDPSLYTLKHNKEWSIQEQAGHLLDLEALWIGRVEDMKNGLPEMRAADLENKMTHQAGHNRKVMKDILSQFEKERSRFVKELSSLREESESLSALHPRLKKPMRLIDLAYFVAEHDDHHLASITLLVERFTKNEQN